MAVTLPALLVKSLGLSIGESVSLSAQAGGIYLAPVKRKKYSSGDLVAMQGRKPMHIDAAWDGMPAMGIEARL